MNNNQILNVIFGTGPLGQSVMRELVRRGEPVRMVNRSGKSPNGIPADVEIAAGDVYNQESVRELCRGAKVVYQCAQPAYLEWVQKFPPLQQNIMEGAGRAGAKFIVGDNLYMYGEVTGPIHEGLPNAAHTRKGKTRALMAEAVLEAHRNGRVRAAIGRAPDFYGPGVLDSTLGERAILPAMRGKAASLVGKLDIPHTYSYIDDFGKALVTLGERDEALGQVWHVPNPPTLTQRQLMTLFFEELGMPAKMSGMGKLMMSLGGLFIPEARESVEMMYEFERPFVVDHSKYAGTFGEHFTPHDEAVKQTIVWYRQYFNL